MHDENVIPVDEDLLDWMPPELVERARQTAEKDAGIATRKTKKSRADLTTPPEGKSRPFSLAALAGGALLLIPVTYLSATGAGGAQNLLEKGRLWLALWLVSQAATLCAYLLCLLPLREAKRRSALVLALGAGLAFALAASAANMLRGTGGNTAPSLQIAALVVSMLLAMAVSPNLWLILGVLRRRSTEKFSALMGGINLGIGALGLLAALAGGKADALTPITALSLVQGLCYLCMLISWPILDRAVLSEPEGANDGQPE